MFDYNSPFSSFSTGIINGADIMHFTEEEKKQKLRKAANLAKRYNLPIEEALNSLNIKNLSREDIIYFHSLLRQDRWKTIKNITLLP